MAASTQNPNGFSYAQAAKGKAVSAPSQTPSSKVTSGTATPANGTFSELASSSNWADDVEANEGEKPVDSRKADTGEKDQKEVQEPKDSKDQEKAMPVKDIAVERTKSESRINSASSGVSSPDLAAPSSITNTDDSSSVPNGMSSSDTTWETKSQNSEPAWIAERKERQTTGHHEDGSSPAPATGTGSNKRGKKEGKEAKEPALTQPPQKPVVLHEAPPPPVNIWAKRMEDAIKTKPIVSQASKPAATVAQSPHVKENGRPKAEARKKANSIASAQREPESQASDSRKSNGTQTKRAANEPRPAVRQTAKPVAENARADTTNAAPVRTVPREAQHVPNLPSAAPPPVKDETSWPTPDSAQEKERKAAAAAEKESEDADTDANAAGKSRDKTKWTPLPVTPTIVWQTEEMNRPRGQGGERGGRGSTTARGRGGLRGAPNGSKGGERAATRVSGTQSEVENASTGRDRSGTIDREAMPPPAKPSSVTREGNKGSPEGQPGVAAGAESRPTKSPSKADFDAKTFEPSSRQASHDIRADDARDGQEALRDASTKKGSFEHKKEIRSNYDSFGANGKEFAGRGKVRGGRGRGGAREFANGHQPSASFTNGHIEYGGAAYGVPPSPSFQAPRGSHSYAFTQPGRGGWARSGNSRSQSIPVEQIYGRPQGPPVQTYYPGMYEYPGAMPMTPTPFSPMMDPQYVVDMVSTQLEYYFSLDNLLKDMFLRKNMDTQGFVFLDVIANFNRLKQLTVDKDLIKFVCLKSEVIEIRVGDDGKDRLRRREGWEQFVLPMDQREVGAQTSGPQELHRPEPVQLPYWPGHHMSAFRGPPSAGFQAPRASHDSSFAMNGGVSQFAPMSHLAYGGAVNDEENRGRAAKSPAGDNGSPTGQTFATSDSHIGEPDVFADEHISSLTVVVKMNQPRANPHHNAASRTFSNGSIDTRSVYAGMEKDKDKPAEDQAQPVTNGEPLTNGDKPHTTPSRHASPSLGRSPEKTDAASELMLLWVKDKEIPQESLPQDAALEPYVQLRVKALKQREQAATGACPYDLDVLYQFWSHFLIRNFNNRMYGEFKFFAGDDAQQRRSPVGLQNLVQFYAKALASSNPIRDHIVKDYVDLVKAEPTILNGQARKQLRQAWRNGALNLKNRKKLADILDDDIKRSLEA